MAHQAAEKLYILGDISIGLLARVYNILEFQKPPVLSDPQLDPYLKKLEKGFPFMPENTAKATPGSDLFGDRAMEIVTGLTDYYNTFKDIMNFREEAWKLLRELSDELKPLEFKTAPDILTYYMDLFTRYVQLHVLISRVSERRLMLACYAKAYHHTAGNTEPKFTQIATFIEANAIPQKFLRAECEPLAKRLAETLGGLTMNILPWGSLSGFSSKKVFNLLEESKLELPNDADPLAILSLHRMQEWVVWGFFACPSAIINENSVNLLCDILKDNFLMPVYRDQVLNMHEEFVPIFDKNIVWVKKEKGAFKITKHKKAFKTATENLDAMKKAHEDMRVYLSHEVELLVELFQEFPSLLAPRIQLVFAAAHMLVFELEWFFRHLHQYKDATLNLPKKKDSPLNDSMVAGMFSLVHELNDLVIKHKRTIQQYYLKFMAGLDHEMGKTALDSFRETGRGSKLVNELLALILDHCSTAQIDGSFHHIRLNWYRVSAATANLSANCHDGQVANISSIFGKIALHTRNVDCVESQLNLQCSLKNLFWYRDDISPFLHSLVDSHQIGQGRHLLSIVRMLESTLYNVHRLCPEEQKPIGKASSDLANAWLRKIVAACEILVKAIAKERGALRLQTSESEVIPKLQSEQQTALPGRESYYPRTALERANIAKSVLGEICYSIFHTDVINVYNAQFVPREYLYDSMQLNVRATLRNFVKASNQTVIQRPSIVLTRLRDLMYAYQVVEEHLNINMSDIFRDVLLSEFSDEAIESEGTEEKSTETKAAPEPTPKDNTAIQIISNWYANWFASDLGARHICYSPTVQAFIAPNNTNNSDVDAEQYTNPVELQALCTLLGPNGLRVLDGKLLAVVAHHVGEIKKIIQANQTQLVQLEAQFTERPIWIGVRDNVVKMDELVTASAIVGSILRFRMLVRKALGVVMQQQVPSIYEVVRNTYTKIHIFKRGEPDFAPLDGLASDVGIYSLEADHALRIALQRHKTQPVDANVWYLVPEAFGMAMTSKRWREAKYNVVVAGHNNNVHCAVETIRALICSFSRLLLPNEQTVDPDTRIQAQYERFLLCASYSTLHMRALQKENDLALQHVMVFIEQFITGSEGRLTLSMLERCYPYTMLRTNYIQLYEKQTKTAYSGGEKMEEDDEEKKTKPEAATESKAPPATAPEKKDPK